jgi:hypothetical protein
MCLALQGCVAAGAAMGATGAVVGTGAKVVGAVGRVVVPGESKKDREAREFKAWQKAHKNDRR